MSWTIERPPGRPVQRTGDNRLAVPLRLCLTGGQATDTELTLTLTLAEAEHLHAALCRALDGEPTPPTAPDCRQSVQASPGTAHILGRA
ncbi:hypothetical protein [Streptomyces europaeiscabiei]|uniref:hypothetical protein n=1 Tax=Streptomyces europaeiscabiei TaxID=146819 RepID=UPI0029AC1454|nr:hypothetical protein [Streptomyces europaeiscabiei]MDX2760915.1 hypothetical protein [Streptomyces europaeiscabiei]MDX2773548.1 hypothetical protein [Streptomyces europaeiscabiei]MDX3831125.1 hypothetical protein [Streptomyces europaeiscabiei]MDX3862701.1 hypothetical protein [Streptomyces europaeiscabiei]MDX3870852.1 hypothetical protein [Streptomyces europaeiscabiei]